MPSDNACLESNPGKNSSSPVFGAPWKSGATWSVPVSSGGVVPRDSPATDSCKFLCPPSSLAVSPGPHCALKETLSCGFSVIVFSCHQAGSGAESWKLCDRSQEKQLYYGSPARVLQLF